MEFVIAHKIGLMMDKMSSANNVIIAAIIALTHLIRVA